MRREGGWEFEFCWCQPDMLQEVRAPTSTPRDPRPGQGAGNLTSSRCFTMSSVLLLAGALNLREKAKGQCEHGSKA